MASYSPFGKQIKDVEIGELAALTHVSEGWYVEYKRQLPNAESIAKSVSAFANTYGGWLFYGIEEKSKTEPVAGAFPGIPNAALDAALNRIRQAIATLVNPPPHFEAKVLSGPCDAIGLAAGCAIISIHTPLSPTAPHVHKNGVIYRRIADSSEPKPETDRHTLEQLWRRSDDLRKEYAKWVEREPALSEAQSNASFLRLLLVADLWQNQGCWAEISASELRSLMNATEEGAPSRVPFDNSETASWLDR